MIFDSHVHTTFSVDADTTIAEAMQTAKEKRVGLVITDHMDWDFPAPYPEFRVDLSGFFREYAPLRSEKLLLGIELGLTANSLAVVNEIAVSHDFDFVLGSVHIMDGREVDDTLYREKDEREVYRAYLLEAAMLLETADVDALAHVDYPLRTTSAELPYADYRVEFAALFDVLVRRNIVLELNTSRLADQAARSNLQAIYCAYRDCGGRYVTLGSDAHEHQEIADNFTIAADFLQEIGLIPVHFCKRKMLIDQQKMG